MSSISGDCRSLFIYLLFDLENFKKMCVCFMKCVAVRKQEFVDRREKGAHAQMLVGRGELSTFDALARFIQTKELAAFVSSSWGGRRVREQLG